MLEIPCEVPRGSPGVETAEKPFLNAIQPFALFKFLHSGFPPSRNKERARVQHTADRNDPGLLFQLLALHGVIEQHVPQISDLDLAFESAIPILGGIAHASVG